MSRVLARPTTWIAVAGAMSLTVSAAVAQDAGFAFSEGSFAGTVEDGGVPSAPIGVQPMSGPIPTAEPGAAASATRGNTLGCVLCPTTGQASTAMTAFTATLPSRLRPSAPDGAETVGPSLPTLLSPNGLLGNTTTDDGGFGDGSFEGEPPATTGQPPAEDPARTSEPEPEKKQPETAGAPANDDEFAVNDFDTRQQPEVRREEPTEKPETKPEPERRAEREDQRKPEEVDRETRPGGNEDFGPGGDFDDPDTRQTERQRPPERETRPEPRRRADQQPPRQQGRRPGRDQRQGPRVDPGITAFETRDFGVPANPNLRQQRLHGPTPSTLPGGHVITTERLARAMVNGERFVLVDVLQSEYTLPNAWGFRAMASGGNFQDRVQYQVANWLAKVTERNANHPIVVFCSDPMCWMSYNAGLRALAAGYRNVYWYRGGLRAWQMAGLRMVASGF